MNTNHSTNRPTKKGWSTARIALYALFVALGITLSFFAIPFPPLPFLKYDFSGVICLIAAFAYGPAAGVTVSILTYVPHLFSNPVGALMNMAVMILFSLTATLIYQRNKTRPRAALGLVVGGILATILALLLNLVVTPLYYHVNVMQYVGMIIPFYLPFNLAKMGLNAVITFLCYKPVSLLAKKAL